MNSNSTTPTNRSNHGQPTTSAVTPEGKGENSSSSRQSKRHRREEQAEPDHHHREEEDGGGNGGTTTVAAASNDHADDSDDDGGTTTVAAASNAVDDDMSSNSDASHNNQPLVVFGNTTVQKEINDIVRNRLWSTDLVVVIASMHCLRDLFSPACSNFEENRNFAFRRGAPIVVVKAMIRHNESSPVQGYGCALLAGIIPPTLTDHVEKDIIDVGGLAQCLVAMDRFIEKPSQQMACMKLLGMLWRRLPYAQKCVIEAGGPGAVIRAMTIHKQNPQVQQLGFYVFSMFLKSEYCWAYSASAEAGFIEAMIDAMNRFPDDAYLQRVGCMELCAFAKRHERYRDEINKEKGLAAVLQAQSIHSQDDSVTGVANDAIKAISGLL